MATHLIKTLVPIKSLKTNRLKEHAGRNYMFYDKAYDTLLIQIVPPEIPTAVHYIDDKNIAFLYEVKTKEIVGIAVEGFKSSFLAKHANVERVWSKTIQIQDFGELVIEFEQKQPVIAKEVVEASRPVIQQESPKLATLFERRFATEEHEVALN